MTDWIDRWDRQRTEWAVAVVIAAAIVVAGLAGLAVFIFTWITYD
ncbi:MAG: hypothetical protein ACHQEA_06080 [Gaiellales bacterium]|jgi:hypothetical protein